MSEMIRKITGIGASTNVNYIPVVHYCVCNTAANTITKTATWIGNSDGTETSDANINLYKGAVFAVLFTNGMGSVGGTDKTYKLNINDTGAKDMLLYDNSNINYLQKNVVALFAFDGNNYRVVNGVTSAEFERFKREIQTSIEQLENGKVSLEYDEEQGGFLQDTGASNQPIYVEDGHVKAITGTFGHDKENGSNLVTPIWIDEGIFKSIASSIGGITTTGTTYMQPVYLKSGSITAPTLNIGSDIKPLKMVGGKLQQISADLAKKSEAGYKLKIGTRTSAQKRDGKWPIQLWAKGAEEYLSEIELDLPTEMLIKHIEYTEGTGDYAGQYGLLLTYVDESASGGINTTFVPLNNLANGLVKIGSTDAAVGSVTTPVYVNASGVVQKAAQVVYRGSTNTAVGGTTQPVYVDSNGKVNAIDYTIQASVPTGATFTDEKVKQLAPITTDNEYPILTAYGATTVVETNSARKSKLTYNPYTETLKVKKIILDGTTITVQDLGNDYHTGATKPIATSATSGLKGSWSANNGSNIGALGITIPIYWGTADPTLTASGVTNAVTGSIYIQI